MLRDARGRGQKVDDAILEIRPVKHVARRGRALTVEELYELASWFPEHVSRLILLARQIGARYATSFPNAASGNGTGVGSEIRSNAGIAEQLVLTVGAVEKHIASILTKLRLPPSGPGLRRQTELVSVLALRRDGGHVHVDERPLVPVEIAEATHVHEALIVRLA